MGTVEKVNDVAAYILDKAGPMSTMKLQKLVYYAQAWHLVWDETPLFPEPIEAWANGPVVRALYNQHRGSFNVGKLGKGDPQNLSDSERATIDAVLNGYGALDGRQLSLLTHSERPWREARNGLSPTQPSTAPIDLGVIQDFYSALENDDTAAPVEKLDWSDTL